MKLCGSITTQVLSELVLQFFVLRICSLEKERRIEKKKEKREIKERKNGETTLWWSDVEADSHSVWASGALLWCKKLI
jgi:hypothetical protein